MIREKIVRQMRAIGKEPDQPMPFKELQKLRRAASRLDQMLKAAADADQQALKNAAARLDQLLSDLRARKDVSTIRRRPR